MTSSQEQQPAHNAHLLMTATFSQRFGNLSASKQPIQKPDWRGGNKMCFQRQKNSLPLQSIFLVYVED